MINTKSQWSIQRSSSWATNYKEVNCLRKGEKKQKFNEQKAILRSAQHFWYFDALGAFIVTCSLFDLGDQPNDMATSIWFGSGGQWAQVSEARC